MAANRCTCSRYDQIASVTSELFDNYMEYKQLIKHVQDILTQSDAYEGIKNYHASGLPVGGTQTDMLRPYSPVHEE
jgi:hypothetical protein